MSKPLISSRSQARATSIGTRHFRRFRLRHLKALSVLLIPCVLSLPARSHGSTDNWTGNNNDTFWDIANNWDAGVPTSSTDAIDLIGQLINVRSGGTFNTFTSNGSFNVTGGTFSGGQSNSASTVAVSNAFTVNGGTLYNLTINPGTGGQGVAFTSNGNNAIDSVIFNSSVDFFTDTGAYAILYNANTLNGLLTMGTSSGLRLYDGNASLTIGNAGTVQGNGNIYEYYTGNTTLINNGVINANTNGSALNISSSNFTNNNLLEATGGGILNLGTITLTNNGQLTAGSGSAVNLNGTTYIGGAAGTLNQQDTGTLLVNGANLSGTIAVTGTKGLSFNGSGNNGINTGTITGNLDFSSAATGGNAYALLYNVNTFNNGIISLGTSSGLRLYDGNASLTIGNAGTVQGNGNIYEYYTGGTTLTNNGVINANTNGSALTISNAHFTNNSLLEATNGGILNLGVITLTNNGALTAGTGSAVNLNSTTYSGAAGSTLNQVGTGSLLVNGANLNGTLAVTGTTGLSFNGNGNNGINTGTITGNLDFSSAATGGNAYALLYNANTFNNGIISLGTSNGLRLYDGNASLTIGNAGTVQGNGNIYEYYTGGTTLTNNGTINANTSGQPLTISNAHFTNNSLAEATGGGILNLGAITLTNNGQLTAGSGSAVNLNGTTYIGGAAGTLNQQDTGTLLVNGANLSGTIAVTGTKGLSFNGSGNNGINTGTITGNLDFSSAATGGNAYALLYNANTFNNGIISLGTSSGLRLYDGAASLTIGNAGTVQGNGNIYEYYTGGTTLTNNGVINASTNAQALNIGNAHFTNNNLLEATGGGILNLTSGVTLTNNGQLTAGSGSAVNLNGTTYIGGAAGTLNQQGTGSLLVNGANLNGTIAVTGNTGLSFNSSGSNSINNGTITGNLDFATDVNAFALLTGANTFNNGTISLGTSSGLRLYDGAASLTIGNAGTVQGSGNIYEYYTGVTTLTNNGTINANTSGQTLTISNANFTSTGRVNVAAGSILTVSSAFNQTGGNTNADGTLNVNGGLNISGGTLTGTGTVVGNVTTTSGGEVSPGHSPGTLTINGNYHQTGTGLMLEELGGSTAGTQYDVLNISGALTLDSGATLDVSLVNGFTPYIGEIFNFITYGSSTGTFVIDSQNQGFTYSYQDNGTGKLGELIVTGLGAPPVTPSTPEPGSLALFVGLGLTGAGFLARRRKQNA